MSALLPLMRRSATAPSEYGRPRRAHPVSGKGKGRLPKPQDFGLGEEVYVPRVDGRGQLFGSWCTVTRQVQGAVIVSVPKLDVDEEDQRVPMSLLIKEAERQAAGPAGEALKKLHALQAQVANLSGELRRAQAEIKRLRHQPVAPGALVPYQPPVGGKRSCGRGAASGISTEHEHLISPADDGGASTALVVWTGTRARKRQRAEKLLHAAAWKEAGDASGDDDEDEVAAGGAPVSDDDDNDDDDVLPTWTKVPLRCAVTCARLTDPGRFAGCSHPARCNFSALRGKRACPLYGCSAVMRRCADLVRDDALRAAIERAPSSAQDAWISARGRVRLAPPTV